MAWIQLFAGLLCALYAALVVLYAQQFFGGAHRGKALARYIFLGAMAAHLGFLLYLTLRPQGSLSLSFSGFLSILALALAISYFLIEWISKEKNMGMWVLVFPLAFMIISALRIGSETPKDQDALLFVHVLTAMIGYCAFSLSAAFAVMYLVQYRQLKTQRLGLIFERLPSLEKTEIMGSRAVYFGLGFLLFSIVLGAIMYLSRNEEGGSILANPRILFALFSCLIYGVAVLMRRALSIRGKRFALVSLAGFGLILLLVIDFVIFGHGLGFAASGK